MTSTTLQIRDGNPHFVLHEEPHTPFHPNCVRIQTINLLVSNTELSILNKTKNAAEGLVLGGVGVGKVLELSGARDFTEKYTLNVGDIVVVSSKVPCQECAACEKYKWDECKNPKTAGLHTNGIGSSDVWVHHSTLTPVEVNPDVESVRQFLLHEWVSTGIWLSAHENMTKDSVIGVIGRPFIIQLLKSVIEDLAAVEVVAIQPSLVSGGTGRFDIIIDCDGEGLLPEDVVKLVRPGGALFHSYTAPRVAALERLPSISSLRQIPLQLGPSFLAVEWIAQNPQYFKEMGAAFEFSPTGLEELLKNEGVRETYGFMYFELRPQWVQWSNGDQGVVLNSPVENVV